MTDNTQYTKGYDFYEGNTITQWAKLDARFVYLRAAIGVVGDINFSLYAAGSKAVGLAVGAFHELWPTIGASAHERTLKAAHALELTTLPPALAFEKEPVKDKHRGYVWTWPSARDMLSYYTSLANQGREPMIYINQDGLNQMLAQGVSRSTFKNYLWWIARYYEHPEAMGEMGVDDTLTFLEMSYSIPRANILFMQTSKGGIPYPAGFSPDKDADIDRAVSYRFLPVPPPVPVPPPAPVPAGSLLVHHENGLNEAVSYFDADPIDTIADSVTGLIYEVRTSPAPVPDPSPTPEPPGPAKPRTKIYRVKYMFERPEDERPSDPFHIPDVKAGNAESVTILTAPLQWFWFGLLRHNAPATFNDEAIKNAWRSLTDGDRAFTNFKGSDKYRDFINGTHNDMPPMQMPKFYVVGGNFVEVVLNDAGKEITKDVRGEACYMVLGIDPTAELLPDVVNERLTPTLVHRATVDVSAAKVDPFPQLDGNDVPVPLFAVGGFNWVRTTCLEPWPDGEPLASPYLPARTR